MVVVGVVVVAAADKRHDPTDSIPTLRLVLAEEVDLQPKRLPPGAAAHETGVAVVVVAVGKTVAALDWRFAPRQTELYVPCTFS